MTTLCFYQGLRTIGGTVLEIATEQARCLFDFGLVYAKNADTRIKPRQHAALSDSLKLKNLPMIDGLYDRKDLRDVALAPYGVTEPRPIVLISHMHIDHMGGLGLLAQSADVYMSKDSLLLYQGLVKARDIHIRAHRGIHGVAPMEWQKQGDISFRMIPVDHDIPGACGFEITTPDGRICYTGDLRLHGFTNENTLRFASLAKDADVCITEGVSASFIEDFDAVTADSGMGGMVTERQVVEEIAAAVQATAGPVFLNVYNRNIRRLQVLHEQFEAIGRQFVLEPETALLYRQFYPSALTRVFAPLENGMELPGVAYVRREDLQAHPERYVLQLSYEHLLDTLDFEPERCLYIHSDGVPLGAYDPGFEMLRQFLAERGIAYRQISSGGHVSPAQLKYLLMEIAPKILIPLHTLKPEIIRIPGSLSFLPETGKCYRLEHGKLKGEA